MLPCPGTKPGARVNQADKAPRQPPQDKHDVHVRCTSPVCWAAYFSLQGSPSFHAVEWLKIGEMDEKELLFGL